MKKSFITILLGVTLFLAACGEEGSDENTEQQTNDESQGDKGTISIGMNNWAENVAVSNMWKIILEDKGYNVELTSVEKAFLYEALSAGDLDIGMEIWLPNTDQAYYNKYKEEIDWRENWYEGTDLALVVPKYMEDVNSIEDLNNHKEEFDSQIVGIDAGASIMSLTEEVIDTYGLDYKLASSSEPTMLTELQNNIENENPVVVTLWKPHWAFSEMDLKILEDPQNVYGEAENISYAARKGLEEDQPEVVKWFDQFELNDQQLGSLMATIKEAESEEDGAQAWIDQHQELIDKWTE